MNDYIGLSAVLLLMAVCDQGLCLSSRELTSRLENSRTWLFKRSEIYKGRRYYLSQQDPISVSEVSMATCVLHGGYLAEINDEEEFNFIKTFINKFGGFKLVLIGGTDEEAEEVWKYRQSKKAVPNFLLNSKRSGTNFNCLYLFYAVNWKAIDEECFYKTPTYPTRYLCEIPENKG